MRSTLTVRFLFFLAVFYPAFSVVLRPLDDPDFWYHLKAGEVILQNFSLPESDPFSFTATEPSRFYSWLPEICFYLCFKAAGFIGVKLFLSLLLALFSWRFWNFFFQLHPRPTLCFLATLLTSFMVGSVAGPRPQFISYLLLGQLLLTILEMEHSSQLGGGKNHLRIFFFFPALFLLWANTHILFAVGLLFLGIYTMAKIWPLLLDVPALPLFRDWFSLPLCSSFQPAKKNLPLLWLWIACFLVTFINPYGIGIFFEFFTHLSHQWSWNHIAEIQPPTPRLLIANLYYLLAILSIIWLTLYWSAFSLWEWMLLLLSLLMPFLSVKFLPVPFLVALPILARHVSFSAFATAENFKFPPRLNFLIFLTAVLGIFFQFLRVKSMPNPYENAVNFLLKSSPSGNLANHYNDGSYLLYRLWPDKKVFIYSRAPIFSERFLKNDFGGLELEEGSQPWQQVLDKHKIEVVLWPTNRPLTYVLDAAGWKKIYSDKKFSIFERPRD